MSSIPRQLATFFAVLAVLYAAGAIAGQFIDPEPHDKPAQEQREGHGQPVAPHSTEPEGGR